MNKDRMSISRSVFCFIMLSASALSLIAIFGTALFTAFSWPWLIGKGYWSTLFYSHLMSWAVFGMSMLFLTIAIKQGE